MVSVLKKPDIARARRTFMFAPFVLESFFVLIKHSAVLSETERGHRIRHKHRRTIAFKVDYVHLVAEVALRRIAVGLNRSRKSHMTAVDKGKRSLASIIGGQAFGRTAFARHHIDVHRPFTVGCECYFTAVGAPHRRGVVASRSNPARIASGRLHRINVAFISKGYGSSVGRYGRVAEPKRRRRHPGKGCGKHCRCNNLLFHCNTVIMISSLLQFP